MKLHVEIAYIVIRFLRKFLDRRQTTEKQSDGYCVDFLRILITKYISQWALVVKVTFSKVT